MASLATRIGPADHGRAMTLEQTVHYALEETLAASASPGA